LDEERRPAADAARLDEARRRAAEAEEARRRAAEAEEARRSAAEAEEARVDEPRSRAAEEARRSAAEADAARVDEAEAARADEEPEERGPSGRGDYVASMDDAVGQVAASIPLEVESPGAPRAPQRGADWWVRVAISAIVLVFALAVIVTSNDDSTRNWAFGAVGTILGYWFNDQA